jgi:hypothetical protein
MGPPSLPCLFCHGSYVPPNRAIPLRIGLCPAVRRVLFDDGAKVGAGKQREVNFPVRSKTNPCISMCAYSRWGSRNVRSKPNPL